MTMNTTIEKYYQKFRKASPFMPVGHNAEQALSAARTLAEWKTRDDVRIVAEEEQESYFDVYGYPDTDKERKAIAETIANLGCWYVFTEYRDEKGEWQQADSIGMNVGYNDPCSPFENCYVIGMMQAALDCSNSPEYAI